MVKCDKWVIGAVLSSAVVCFLLVWLPATSPLGAHANRVDGIGFYITLGSLLILEGVNLVVAFCSPRAASIMGIVLNALFIFIECAMLAVYFVVAGLAWLTFGILANTILTAMVLAVFIWRLTQLHPAANA